MILSISSHCCVGVFLLAQSSPPPPPELSVICSNQNMGLCKVLLKTELGGEKGGGVVIDFYKTVVTISSVIG